MRTTVRHQSPSLDLRVKFQNQYTDMVRYVPRHGRQTKLLAE